MMEIFFPTSTYVKKKKTKPSRCDNKKKLLRLSWHSTCKLRLKPLAVKLKVVVADVDGKTQQERSKAFAL